MLQLCVLAFDGAIVQIACNVLVTFCEEICIFNFNALSCIIAHAIQYCRPGS